MAMPKRRKVTEKVKKTGKKVLATDTVQGVVEAVVDKIEEIAVDKADDAAQAVKKRPLVQAAVPLQSAARPPAKTTGRKTTGRKSTVRKS
jgi:hypothetical protein